ncbi:crotonyl-CoA carboxylase/reductase [Leptospira sp. 201903071]|uniref:crotonyl-CoA carboxylase/reductase n=1 Tax=Leptospira ainazelensis TaxID=2810034 RepID=UPI001966226E|nr:crotonyl-CoA carboxylase/reductase [Leptospira ainazelensis]MBM9499644.1 crotonyl-CoA carboxylase/reductase [Leptospira ainazelensis]
MKNRPLTISFGEIPYPDRIPKYMIAQVIRPDRFGEPEHAFVEEEVPVPQLAPNEVLIAVKAAGVNFNNVWAAAGYPLDVINHRIKEGELENYHIGGSDAAGIVVQIGSKVQEFKIGEEVVIQPGSFDSEEPCVKNGGDPTFSSKFKAWGYETNFGAFAQFCKVKSTQCLPKPSNLSWEESACFMLTGATAFRMLTHWNPNHIRKNDLVLIWGGSGGLGAMAIQLTRKFEAVPIAVVNSLEKGKFCLSLGAEGYILRNEYSHWGSINKSESSDFREEQMRSFQRSVRNIGFKNPNIVIEHPGEDTIPTSLFVCDREGMVVICGGTTGYLGSFGLSDFFKYQKRLQGSHFANPEECKKVLKLVGDREISPALTKVFSFQEIPKVHQQMKENVHPYGNIAISFV